MDSIRENIENIKNNLNKNTILVAVTKYRSIDEIQKVLQCGIKDLGENRVQEFKEKFDLLPKDIRWHLIGHLQKNKVKYVIGKTFLIHSVDSVSLAEEISRLSIKSGIITDILVQVNVAKEDSKYGFDQDDLETNLRKIDKLDNIRILGLMVMAPNTKNTKMLEDIFTTTKNLYDKIKSSEDEYNNLEMKYLSMGMTNDYDLAVKCGSNMVRVGSGIFK
ncbi:YggS family pyridoxal phosphate-dependent enzyme [Alkalibacter mobilis]|uniref:YggS family pyridoxal phosphate-dependent enzyme n=1 Tax=Alkalibacter mobilis TaxID=2787712 RepID=UPI0018A1021A|nr:YggS family pyridoxal phosphate-dependent enzyme [Alkalibacter mobilis]MBF7095871.1 YggS family pyridoxal phosphate-dependent enzyme [Alkalibacter mobilis]